MERSKQADERDLVIRLLIRQFHAKCVCSDTYECGRCEVLGESEELFPDEFQIVAGIVPRSRRDRK